MLNMLDNSNDRQNLRSKLGKHVEQDPHPLGNDWYT